MRPRLIFLGLAACLLTASPVLAGQASAATVPSFGHVFVIIGENKALTQITSSNAPYIMNTLKPASAWFTDYHDVATGSLADYMALTSGQYASCQTSGPCGVFSVPSIFSQLGDGAWKDWNESMPSNCYTRSSGSDSTLNAYKPGHNPALYYAGLPCSTYDVPAGTTGSDDMSSFNNALAAGTVPKYSFIAPNVCEDGHDSCNGANTVTEYNNFLAKEIPLIESSPAFGSDGVIFATYDEGSGSIMMAVTGPQVQAGTYAGHFDHYSTVATIEQGLGLPCLANACAASTLPAFGGGLLPPSVSITQPASGSTVSGTATVAGTAAAQGGASISQVQVSVDNGTPQTATGTTSWSAGIDTTSLASGTHTITATVTDSNNLSATASITVNVSNGATACPAPPSGATELSGNVSVESGQTGWTGKYNSQSVVTRVEPAGGSYDGLWALQVAPASGTSGAAGVSNANPVWVTNTAAGQVYEGSVLVNPSVAGEKVSLLVKETTSSGTKVASHVTTITTASGWQQITSTYTAQNSGDYIRYSVYASNFASSSQNFLADCLSLWSP
ncbi:MAG TPA: alkaline phosphatase family protein [Streptosporangiaceae bacterium]|nr:alkaline phosphatase family protein [Streptosporangiaceae bacterium]